MNDQLYALETALEQKGYAAVCGVDEAGCGPLAGPVCAAAVILDPRDPIDGLNDSKKLSEKKRDQLFPVIQARALAYSIAFATAEEIDTLNILQARLLAMRRAVAGLSCKPGFVLVDGNRDPEIPETESLCVIGGDGQCACIAAASILAKVSRDRVMRELAQEYPVYRFEQHKGYPTALHVQLLLEHGPCPQHRKSFLKKIYARAEK